MEEMAIVGPKPPMFQVMTKGFLSLYDGKAKGSWVTTEIIATGGTYQ